MLNRIALFNFFTGVVILYFLSKYVHGINILVENTSWKIEIIGKNFSIFNVAIPFLIALISRIIKLHDRISDILGIRKRYDVKYILTPIAEKAGYNTNDKKKFVKNRRVLMSKLFYKYASSIEKDCIIDYHDVIMAMDQFGWYWVMIEVEFLLIIGILFSLAYRSFSFSFDLIIILLASFLISQNVLMQCKRYTSIEVDKICNDVNRKNEILNTLNAL